jgi:hypothetical protein
MRRAADLRLALGAAGDPGLTFMAKRPGARITDVNAGHLSLISEPSVVTRVILEAVQATG